MVATSAAEIVVRMRFRRSCAAPTGWFQQRQQPEWEAESCGRAIGLSGGVANTGLAGVTKVRNYRHNFGGRGPPAGADCQQQLHQASVDVRRRGGLYQVDLFSTDRLLELNKSLAVSEVLHDDRYEVFA